MSTNNEIKDFDETAVENKLDYRNIGDSQHQLTGLGENTNSPLEINTFDSNFEPAVNVVDEKTTENNDTSTSNEIEANEITQAESDNRTFNKIDSPANINNIENNTQLDLLDENITSTSSSTANNTIINTGNPHTHLRQVSSTRLKKSRKSIFISYSPDACYLEKRFIAETVQQLKENNLSDDIWFDKDERNTNNPCWFSLCLEAAEKCKAALLFLSESYFSCPVSLYEGKILLDRYHSVSNSVKIFSVLVSKPAEHFNVPEQFSAFIDSAVDLTAEHAHKSSAEKTSVVVGALMEELEKLAVVRSSPQPLAAPDAVFTEEFKKQKICQWSASDLQEWLFSLGIKEFYRQSLAEASIDGFLLMSLTDHDLSTHLGIDNRVVRKKIMQSILNILNNENKLPENWHLRARVQKSKSDLTYLIYDPADVRLAQNLKADLKSKNLQVIHHNTNNLGRSKEEFLETNGPVLASASNVIVIVTEDASKSPFVFHEVLFADWLGKKIVTAMFKNVWNTLRPSLRAVLGDCPAVDFETKMYAESLEILEHSIKPLRRVPGVVLEQTYLNKMADGLKPLESLVHSRSREFFNCRSAEIVW
ncbi:uncharacterized protein LOC131938958 isoform X2 [Physella acuta]|uniref:uncharacterized protein LOC131938958 isoform X2 n=1 Tax=Physella acuta TaxID=109671 RepID=UPI0027DD751B|nr:uncharacterized protein LOC131938958 isoform X2 [Physella acuta]